MRQAESVASSTVSGKPWNRESWNDARTVSEYQVRQALTPGEMRIFGEAWPEIRGGHVLDIGVGAGRTIPYLAGAGASYSAIDYAPAMVKAARQRFPRVDIREGDACDLAVPAEHYNFVLFSYNGIDYIHPDDRNKVLTEVFRVLRPGGLFAFSTHNKNVLPSDGITVPIQPPAFTLNLPRYAVRAVRSVREKMLDRRNRNRLRSHALWRDDIAFVIDGAHLSSMLTSYVKPQAQLDALRTAGFGTPLLMVDDDGRVAAVDGDAPWIYFLVRKPG